MSDAPVLAPSAALRSEASTRIASIDIFRGLTMLVMIFVNDLSDVTGLPWWTYHAREQQDVMTYVDMVFPFFLFIVGLSLPLALARRLTKNPSFGALWLHIGSRTIGLIVLGLILANAEKGDPARMGLSTAAWALLALSGAILFWLVPTGRNAEGNRVSRIHFGMRELGLLLLTGVFAVFRRTIPAGFAWIDSSYPEILGIIGFAYFSAALLYLSTRRWTWAPLGWFAVLTAFCALLTARLLHLPEHLPPYLWPFGAGDSASITMAGVVTSTIFLGEHRWSSPRQKMALALIFALMTLVAAWLLAPLGISKIRGTPTWCLASIGASVLAFTLLYWVCDVRGHRRWAVFLKPAGENTLLTYLLPDLYYYLAILLGFRYLNTHLRQGLPGVLRSVFFTAVILGTAALLTRWRIRLQL